MPLIKIVIACLMIAILPLQAIPNKELPKEIIAEGQWIIADMDGTLIGVPGYKKEPTLEESVAKDAIVSWLRAGGQLLVITSCETLRTIERFARFIPQDLWQNVLLGRRLLLSTNGGANISYFNGEEWVEDRYYLDSALPTRKIISWETGNLLLERSVEVINDFYRDLRQNPSLIPENLRNKYKAIAEIARSKHPYDFTMEELITLNSDTVPRIEVRRATTWKTWEIVQICIVGIPSDIYYDVSKLDLDSIGDFELSKMGVTHEITVKGVDKTLPIRWLQKGQHLYPELNAEKSVAVGDRPNHNDAPLTKAVGAFVSVCENNSPSYIPSHVTLRIGHNQAGTKLLLEKLLQKAKEFKEINRLEPVIVHTLEEVVKECNHDLKK